MSARDIRSGEAGITLIEILVTILVVTVGTLITLASFSDFSAAARTAQHQAVLISVAQREMEQLRPVPYDKLALPPGTTVSAAAPLTGPAASETLVTASTASAAFVAPGPDLAYAVQGMQVRIYRYVTWRQQTCANLTTSVQTQVSTQLAQSQTQVSAAIPNLCPGSQHTKRLTVIVQALRGTQVEKSVHLSTVVADPSSALPAAANYAGLKVSQTVATVAPTATPSASASMTTQTLNLYDTRCDQTSRQPTADHNVRDTSQNGAICPSGGSRPDLMGLTAIPGAASATLNDYAKDITRAAAGGLVLMRDDRAGACTGTGMTSYTNQEASTRMRSLHTWATNQSTAAFETPTSGGRASLTLWTSTASKLDRSGRLCAVLWRPATGEVLGSADFSLNTWPSSPTQLSIAFDVARAQLATGERLELTLRVPADSGADIQVLYDHPSYQSNLSFTTVAGKEFK